MSSIKKRDQLVILVHEIYGVNDHMNLFKKIFEENGFDVICPNLLYLDESFSKHQEDEAYNNFFHYIGFEKGAVAINKLINQVHKSYSEIYLVGFSVGATIAWICSTQNAYLKGAFCFYGSRIRDYYQKTPKCSVSLFFAENEKSFNVHELIIKLKNEKYQSVDVHLFNADHGFANPYSDHYDKSAYEQSLDEIMSIIKKER
ncbi:dienelactone hydrolase family protein [Niallia sp. 01092]|uniref:dienelactone hydrolase family protein n=1 Tax=unclassified Niallia TaxID=2837522 RepID=UPI003FCF6891